jgi:hypothetical protein
MKQEILLRKNISLGQKTSDSMGAFGDGFNYVVEAGFPLLNFDRVRASVALEGALAKIDHKALGMDVDLGFEPTSEALVVFLAAEIERGYGLSSFRLVRGDGRVYEAKLVFVPVK